MEGYSVDEAATVLGVPTGRVWELLARGVLAGTQEDGGGMRVFLRGERPSPAPVARSTEPGQDGGDRNGNGTGGAHDPGVEASPFRELLTEFRNLTERYGQALLALGEARGEVAGLRARVEVLEARLDLRLPGPAGWASTWSPSGQAPAGEPPAPESAPAPGTPRPPSDRHDAGRVPEPDAGPAQVAEEPVVREEPEAEREPEPEAVAEPAAEPAEEAEAHAAAEPEAEAAREPEAASRPEAGPMVTTDDASATRPHRRRRGSHAAVTGIAEALARAEDPTITSLPGGEEAAEAIAALRERVARGGASFLVQGPAGSDVVDQVSAPEAVAPSASVPAAELEMAAPATDVDLGAPETGRRADEMRVSHPDESEVAAEAPDAQAEPASPSDVTAPQPVAYSSEWDEPDWIAEEDLEGAWEPAEAQAAEPEAAEPEAAESGPAESEPPAGEAPVEAQAPEIRGREPVDDRHIPEMADWPPPPEEELAAEMEPPPPAGREAPIPSAPENADLAAGDDYLLLYEPAAADAASAPPAVVEPGGARPAAAASDALEEELMWLGDEFRPSTTAWQGLGSGPASPPPPTQEPSAEDEELERLARLRGWDEGELAAIRSLLGDQPTHPSEPGPAPPPAVEDVDETAEPVTARGPNELTLPGADELDEAFAALGGTPGSEPAADSVPEPAEQAGETDLDAAAPAAEPTGAAVTAGEPMQAGPAVPPAEERGDTEASSAPVPLPHPIRPPHISEEDWLRGRRGPAATAYRRLRRLFPG